MAPMSDPRIIIAVMIDEPTGLYHYGGDVAAPTGASFAGRYVVKIAASDDDTVTFHQIKRGKVSGPVVNRLSTFISRFDLLHRSEGGEANVEVDVV